MDLQKQHEMDQMDTKANFYEAATKRGDISGYLEYMEGGNPAKYYPLIRKEGETLEDAAKRYLQNELHKNPVDFTIGTFENRVCAAEKPI